MAHQQCSTAAQLVQQLSETTIPPDAKVCNTATPSIDIVNDLPGRGGGKALHNVHEILYAVENCSNYG